MGFCPLLAVFKKILANLSGLGDYKRKLRVHSVQNGQSGFWMLVLIELGTTTNLPTDRLVSAAVVDVATQNSCWKLVRHKAMFSCPCSYCSACWFRSLHWSSHSKETSFLLCCSGFKALHSGTPEPTVLWFTLMFLTTSLSHGGLAVRVLLASAKHSDKTNTLSY